MPTEIAPELLALQRLYAWEKEAPTRVALTQPMGDGSVRDFTWSELAGEVRRMAGHLQSIGIQPGDKVAILSKNCAWTEHARAGPGDLLCAAARHKALFGQSRVTVATVQRRRGRPSAPPSNASFTIHHATVGRLAACPRE